MASHAPPHKVPRPGVETLLGDFQRTRRENTPLTQVVLDTLKKTLGPGSAEMALDLPLGKALMRLTQAVQEDGQANDAGAPDYHNTAHFKEAVMAVGHLCALEFEGEAPCPHLVVLAMTAMVGHDFKHDGTSNETGKSLEAIAWQACEPYLDGVHLEDKKAIEALILGTDPTKLNEHRARYSYASVPPSAIDRLRLIACEADLTPSLMPEHGVEMGKLLAKELKSSNVPVLTVLGERISSWESRMGFLHHAKPISKAADTFGLKNMHSTQLQAFVELAQSLDLSDAKDAARHLDKVDVNQGPSQSSALYLSALTHVDSKLGAAVARAMNLPAPGPLQKDVDFGM